MRPLGWLGIFRLGLVQTALGAIVVLTTSAMNRVMVVEMALPAIVPGALVGLHYALQVLRPRWGYGSDAGGRRTPWIAGGMAVLALGGILASLGTAWMAVSAVAGTMLCVVAFGLIGIGVGACGTNLLALLATRVAPERRAPAATIVWLMMIAGFIVTAGVGGSMLDPFTPARLVAVTTVTASLALLVTLLAIWGVEGQGRADLDRADAPAAPGAFRDAIRDVWGEPRARRFAIFVFVSMLAYSAQDLILEPFAGHVFAMTPGQSTKLSGLQHSGVFVGMVMVALAGAFGRGTMFGSLKMWTVVGCLGSAAALASLVVGGAIGPGYPLAHSVFALGVANGAFAVAAIGSMMGLAGEGKERREGTRMGLWGAAQAMAFGLGGFVGAAGVDLARQFTGDPAVAYGAVFAAESVLFVVAAVLAVRVSVSTATQGSAQPQRSSRPARTFEFAAETARR